MKTDFTDHAPTRTDDVKSSLPKKPAFSPRNSLDLMASLFEQIFKKYEVDITVSHEKIGEESALFFSLSEKNIVDAIEQDVRPEILRGMMTGFLDNLNASDGYEIFAQDRYIAVYDKMSLFTMLKDFIVTSGLKTPDQNLSFDTENPEEEDIEEGESNPEEAPKYQPPLQYSKPNLLSFFRETSEGGKLLNDQKKYALAFAAAEARPGTDQEYMINVHRADTADITISLSHIYRLIQQEGHIRPGEYDHIFHPGGYN